MSSKSLFNTQKSVLEQLHKLLQTEQKALLSIPVDGDHISDIANRKRQLFLHLQELEQTRLDQKTSLDSDTPESNEGSFKESDWQDIRKLAENISHTNKLNGSLIGRLLIHNQKAINVLAELAGKHSYGSDGRTKAVSRNINSSA